MQRKEGYCWEAVYDEESQTYTAGFFGARDFSCTLYLINKELYDQLEDNMDSGLDIIHQGRKLYMHVNDYCGPAYTVVFDENYKEICPWAKVPEPAPEETWPQEMTKAVDAVLGSKKEESSENE